MAESSFVDIVFQKFRQYFVFSCLIKNSTVMGTPDLESTQKGAPADAQIVHFGQDPICTKTTPLWVQ